MKIVLFCIIILKSTIILADDGRINGFIKDAQDGFNLKDVIVQLQYKNISTLSNSSGFFDITEIKYGTYYVVFSKIGYYSLIIPDVKIDSKKPVNLDIEMVAGNEKEYLFLEIGGIQVTANRELLPEEPETIHRITSGEIEHMQANSLSNVLSLIPGNLQSEIPGLSTKQNISLRTFDNDQDDQGALFSTKIIVDDIPISNNANLQTGVGVGYGTSVQKSNNTQIDLREIVADNLEKVAVVTGSSSVEYGDHSQGLIIAKTKTTYVPTRIKFKNNPDTREANLMGSFYTYKTNFIYNLNYGYSERAIRITGDEYQRVSAQLKSKNDFLNRKLQVQNILKYARKIEEDDDDSDPTGKKAYNRDYQITYSHQFEYQLNELTTIYLRNFINFRRSNSWKRQLETPDNAIWTDLLEPGTREGIIPISATYFSEVSTIGHEWTYGSKLRLNRKILSGNTLHRLLFGAEFQTDDNTGPGKTYNLLKPPNGKTSERPRIWNNIPGTLQLAIFAEERISGNLIFPYTIYGGFRIDSYNPTDFNHFNLFKGKDVFAAEQGTFFNPRLGIKLKLFPSTQLRLSYGKSSKSPAISAIYPSPFFLDINDLTYRIENNEVKNVNLITTYKYDRNAPKLKGYQSTKFEMSIDQQISDIGLSLKGYIQKTYNIPKQVKVPFDYYRYFWLDWPEATNKIKIDSVTKTDDKFKVYKNLGKNETSGIEFNLTTHRIESLSMRFTINASYNFKKYSHKFFNDFGNSVYIFSYGDTLPDSHITDEVIQIIPIYEYRKGWQQRAVFNFHIDYISNPLGIWLTFKAQHVRWWQRLHRSNSQPEAVAYYQDGKYYSIDAEAAKKVGFIKSYSETDITTDKSRPNDQWIFSIVLSKSLFRGAEVSLYVENILNDRAYYLGRKGLYLSRNHEIFWGIGFSSKIDEIFN
jgi:hypothetical protein